MTHAPHEIVWDYDPRQIWYDGCYECARLSGSVPLSVYTLDQYDLCRAMNRAKQLHDKDYESMGVISDVERPLLKYFESLLWVLGTLAAIGFKLDDATVQR